MANGDNRVYNVYWEGDWKAKEIGIDYMDANAKLNGPLNDWVPSNQYVYFGTHNGKTYVLYGAQYACMDIWCFGPVDQSPFTMHQLYRLDFVGGSDRYDAIML